MQLQVHSTVPSQLPAHLAGRLPLLPLSFRGGLEDHAPKHEAPKHEERPFTDLATRDWMTGLAGAERSITLYRPGQTIFLQGDPADAVFYIQKGKVQLTVVSKQGKQGVVAILGAGSFFGEACMAGQERHIATATATAESTIARVEKPAMMRLLRDDAKFAEVFMSFLLNRNLQVEDDLIDHLFNSSEKRLARLLLSLADGSSQTIERINQEILAGRVGTTRSRINFFMNKFRKLGLIEYKGTGNLKVHTSLMSVVAAD